MSSFVRKVQRNQQKALSKAIRNGEAIFYEGKPLWKKDADPQLWGKVIAERMAIIRQFFTEHNIKINEDEI